MKKTLTTCLLVLISAHFVLCQNYPTLIIDNVQTKFSEISLPYWLKAGQTINIGTNAQSVSILEFTINGSNLAFSSAITLNSSQTVPANKVWKIEAIGLNSANLSIPASNISGGGSAGSTTSSIVLPTIYQSPRKFEIPGTYNWTVPPGVTSICIEVWSGGGGGSYHVTWEPQTIGGGGGGYAYQCFNVVPGTSYSIVVGAGGSSATATSSATNGGTSSVSGLISVSGGAGANAGGQGGNSTSTFNITGDSGTIGKGGNAANGGNGGNESSSTNSNGAIPGGGGSSVNQTFAAGNGTGGRGQVYIYW